MAALSDAEFHRRAEHFLSDEELQQLRKNKIQLRADDERYLRGRPEIKKLLDAFMCDVLEFRPDDIAQYAKIWFTREGLAERIMGSDFVPTDTENEDITAEQLVEEFFKRSTPVITKAFDGEPTSAMTFESIESTLRAHACFKAVGQSKAGVFAQYGDVAKGQVTWEGFCIAMRPLLAASFQDGLDEAQLKLEEMADKEVEEGTVLGKEVAARRAKGKGMTREQKAAVRAAQAASAQLFDGFAREAEFVFKSLKTNTAGEVDVAELLAGLNAKKEIVRMVCERSSIAHESLDVNGNGLIDYQEFCEWATAGMNAVKATAIQAVYRGRQQRKEAKEQKDAQIKIAAVQRGRRQRKEAKEQKEAAVRIQAVQRGRKTRKQQAAASSAEPAPAAEQA